MIRRLHACLFALLALSPLVASAEENQNARWSLERSDLATWDVMVGIDEEGAPGTPRPRGLSPALFGYQIDGSGTASIPASDVEGIVYDLALKAPLGRVWRGRKLNMAIRYDRLLDHHPVDVALSGKVVEVKGDTFRLEGKAIGIPDPPDEKLGPSPIKWITHLSIKFEIVFDTKRGVMESAVLRLRSSSRKKAAVVGEKPPDPVDRALRFRFKLRRVRRHEPGWKFDIDVGKAVQKGTTYLRQMIQEGGTYGAYSVFPHGETCLVTLTLLTCGVDRDDPFIIRLMEKIRSYQPTTTYEIGIALMAMEAFHAPTGNGGRRRTTKGACGKQNGDLEWMRGLTRRLASIAEKKPEGWGWGYTKETSRADLSNTQYAALGLLAAWRCGIGISEEVWVGLARGVLRHRTLKEKHLLHIRRVGGRDKATVVPKLTTARGYAYVPGGPTATASMTCAAVSSLQIVHDVLRANRSRHLAEEIGSDIQEGIEQGWAWLAGHWSIQSHAPEFNGKWLLYYLYGLERAGVFSRVAKLNGHDWYYEGAAWLVDSQETNGRWQDLAPEIHNTCFALLFLKRGTIPVVTGAGK
ncbi:MAG: hypothetical protein O7H41_08495 [Planctomycetota bacterium]|nr:hypothetical protein [Planctomycetota bacterium]